MKQLVEALRYKLKGRGFVSRWCHWIFSLTYSFRPHCGPGVDSASNRNKYQGYVLRGEGVHRADNLTTFMCRLYWNLGASTFWNPQGCYRDCFTLHAMNPKRENGGISPLSLNLGTGWIWEITWHSGRFTPRKNLCSRWNVSWVTPEQVWDFLPWVELWKFRPES
jgi:hypothetical protein